MTRVGLDGALRRLPGKLAGARIGILCHAASVSGRLTHILDEFALRRDCRVGAVFGPQHGLCGETQDNMIEWEGGYRHPVLKVPVYSLYGKRRKPSPAMLEGLDALVCDLQDVGARPYTYLWTLKLCMEACAELGVPVWIFDRPNPIAALGWDGPMLEREFYSFVGGAPLPMIHRLTIGEIGMVLKSLHVPRCELNVVWMKKWWRDSLWHETGLPWVLPSPNMPAPGTALVYPGMVLLEATSLSEGRGTTRPFEIFGAPFMRTAAVRKAWNRARLKGAVLREHDFIPTFNKWNGERCRGFQLHVTRPRVFRPVTAAAVLLGAVLESCPRRFAFLPPPYEYETGKMPFDILSGGSRLREVLRTGASLSPLRREWRERRRPFEELFREIARYPERCP